MKLTPQAERDALLREYVDRTRFVDKTGKEWQPDELPEVPIAADDDEPQDD